MFCEVPISILFMLRAPRSRMQGATSYMVCFSGYTTRCLWPRAASFHFRTGSPCFRQEWYTDRDSVTLLHLRSQRCLGLKPGRPGPAGAFLPGRPNMNSFGGVQTGDNGLPVGSYSAKVHAACRFDGERPPVEYCWTSRCFVSNVPKSRRASGSCRDQEL